jgi:transcription antitermination factor NusG
MCGDQWYAVRIRARFEKVVSGHLRAKGYQEYLPLQTSRNRGSAETMTIRLPLFPGHIFCKFDLQHRLPILSVPGILDVVGIGKAPAAIPETKIYSIRRIIDSGLRCKRWPYIETGRPVSIKHGPLAGIEGTVLQIRSRLRLIVPVTVLQRSIAVEIEQPFIEAMPPGN